MSAPLRLTFLRSASDPDQLPESHTEWALVGRSNVGKSSLLNALANRKDLARTSKSPGATRLINVYEASDLGEDRWLVDLPGYGYAKASHADRRKWQAMIERYLTERESLAGVLHLIDGEVGPTALDLQTVEWLDHIGLPRRYVATKADKIRSSKRQARKKELYGKLDVTGSDVSWVSAAKGTGIVELRRLLTELLTL